MGVMTLPPSAGHRSRARPSRHRAVALIGGLLLGLAALFALPAGTASAHAAIERTSPAAGSVVQSEPSDVVITFSEHVQAVTSRIQVIDPNGNTITNGKPHVEGHDLHIPVHTDGPHGTYLVSFRVISADSHPVGGSFVYSVGAPSPSGAPTAAGGGTTDPVVAAAVSVEQFIGFAGAILVIGPALVLALLWPRRLDRRGPSRLAFWGLGLVVAGAVAGIYLQAPYGSGGSLFSAKAADLADVMDSAYGKAHLVRIAAALVSIFLLRPVLAGRDGRWDRALLVAVGAIAIVTWPLAGHPGASEVPPLTVLTDAAHLSAAAIWVGGLVMLAAYLLRKATARELSAILPVWSNWATLAVTVLVLAGTVQALIEIGSISALFGTTYGRILLVKIGLLAVILAVANTARIAVARRVRTGPSGERVPAVVGAQDAGGPPAANEALGPTAAEAVDEAVDEPPDEPPDGGGGVPADSSHAFGPGVVRRLRRSVLIEVGLAVCVLIATSILVQSAPGSAAAGEPAITANKPASVTLNSKLYSLQVDFDPTPTGAEIHMYAFAPTGAPLKVVEWTVTAALPARDIEPSTIGNLEVISDSHAIARATLPVRGTWTFTFTLRTTDIDEATVTTQMPIG